MERNQNRNAIGTQLLTQDAAIAVAATYCLCVSLVSSMRRGRAVRAAPLAH